MYDFFVNLLTPIMWGEAWVMTGWHQLFVLLGIPYESGWGWALSIVGLTAVVRFLMIPLFVKQIHSSRRMQLIQPEMQKIQAKYKGKSDPESRQKMTQETMDLYKRTGSNPFSSCLPILLQSPFFFALFQVLNNLPHIAQGTHVPIGPITPDVASVIEKSTIFGAQLSSTFLGSSDINVKVLTAVLIVLMSLSTFTTQRQLMRKNMPDSALDNPYMKQQKVILYLMPIFFAISGVNFPIGVLLYWLTTNVWSMGQQFYVIRRMPAPGSAAERAYEERQRRRGKTIKKLHIPGLGDTTATEADVQDAPVEPPKTGGQRQQPKGKKRNKRTGPGGPGGPAAAGGNGSEAGGGDGPQDAPAASASPNGASKAPTKPPSGSAPASGNGSTSASGNGSNRPPRQGQGKRGNGPRGGGNGASSSNGSSGGKTKPKGKGTGARQPQQTPRQADQPRRRPDSGAPNPGTA